MSYKVTERHKSYLTQLKSYHLFTCSSINWDKQIAEPYQQGEIGPNEKFWADIKNKYNSSKIERLVCLDKLKVRYWESKQKKARRMDSDLYSNWKRRYPFVKKVLQGDQESWREAVRKYATFHKELDVAQAYSLHVYDQKTVECDVFLQPIDVIIPFKIEKITKRGYLRYHDMPKTKRYSLYESYVYSCLLKIVQDLFAVLPCNTIYLNGIAGTRTHHSPIISTVVEDTLDRRLQNPILVLQKHRHMVSFKKRSGFQPIERVYSPTLMIQ
ncbi:hypothetical protein [Halalkalibacter akibai]|uniref:Uncharacterized protein n=1 Tax=Halalkalibacter akibai (strain ATCC 43226 / DSM 21942 / CIP 109018 / JCM 9157 / 1139) TaxID=1236973 RepID=W4QU44_HALA3|nr:hypothetical protein [Halalkalibacter akibai]GAE35601.1 hypothetical protein JCM9157_2715 [Halalkalibacter akibai JCM 9157]